MTKEQLSVVFGFLGLACIMYCLLDNNWKVSVHYYGMGDDKLHQGIWYRKTFEISCQMKIDVLPIIIY